VQSEVLRPTQRDHRSARKCPFIRWVAPRSPRTCENRPRAARLHRMGKELQHASARGKASGAIFALSSPNAGAHPRLGSLTAPRPTPSGEAKGKHLPRFRGVTRFNAPPPRHTGPPAHWLCGLLRSKATTLLGPSDHGVLE